MKKTEIMLISHHLQRQNTTAAVRCKDREIGNKANEKKEGVYEDSFDGFKTLARDSS
jgi:hypothetical protein